MYRSSSSTRVSDEFFSNSSSSSSPPSQSFKPNTDADELPTYNPQSLVAKKERSRLRSAEAAIHLIPLLLVLCAIILWFFSNPAVDLVNKGDSIVARVEGLSNNGNAISSSSSTNSSLLLNSEQHFDPSNEYIEQEDSGRSWQ